MHENGTIITSNSEDAWVLINHFWRMFTEEDFRIPKLTLPPSPEMPEIIIDIEGVKKPMKNLDPFKANGPATIFKANGW